MSDANAPPEALYSGASLRRLRLAPIQIAIGIGIDLVLPVNRSQGGKCPIYRLQAPYPVDTDSDPDFDGPR